MFVYAALTRCRRTNRLTIESRWIPLSGAIQWRVCFCQRCVIPRDSGCGFGLRFSGAHHSHLVCLFCEFHRGCSIQLFVRRPCAERRLSGTSPECSQSVCVCVYVLVCSSLLSFRRRFRFGAVATAVVTVIGEGVVVSWQDILRLRAKSLVSRVRNGCTENLGSGIPVFLPYLGNHILLYIYFVLSCMSRWYLHLAVTSESTRQPRLVFIQDICDSWGDVSG
jgi:hypothetical protein